MPEVASLLGQVKLDFENAEKSMQDFGGKLGDLANSVTQGILQADLIKGAAESVLGFGQAALATYSETEKLGLSLQSLVAREIQTKDATVSHAQAMQQAGVESQHLLKWVQDLAVNSPFTQEGVAVALRTAESYGFVAESSDKAVVSATRLTQASIDYASGSGQSTEAMNSIALALGQIQAKGKLAGQEVLQLTNVGVNVDQILSQAFQKPTSEIVAMREKGLIPANDAIRLIVENMEQNFGGSAKNMANSVSGLQSSLQDIIQLTSADLLGPLFKAAQPYVADLVEKLGDPAVKEEIGQIGAALGDFAGKAIPVVISEGGKLVQFLKDVYEQGQPVFSFIQEEAVPIIIGLATVMVAQAIPAIVATTASMVAMAPVILATTGPIVVIAAAITAMAAAWQDFEAKQDKAAKGLLESRQWWNDSAAALKTYQGESDGVKQKLQGEADALQAQRDQIQANIKELALRKEIGSISNEQYQQEMVSINQQAEVLKISTATLNTHIKTEEDNVKLQELHAAATDKVGGAHQQTAAHVQLSAEEMKKYGAELEKVDSAGAQAFQKLEDSSKKYEEQEQERVGQHQERLTSIHQDGEDKIAQAVQNANESLLTHRQAFQEKEQQLATQHSQQLADLEQQYQQRSEANAQQHQDKLQAIREKEAQVDQQYQADSVKRQADYQDQRNAQAIQGSNALAAIDNQYQTTRQQTEDTFNQKMTDLKQQEVDTVQQYQEQEAQAAQQHADKLTSIQQNYATRIADLEANAAQSAADRAESRQQAADDRQTARQQAAADREASHNDKLAQLQATLGSTVGAQARDKVQAQIDAEDQRYAKENEKAAQQQAREDAKVALQQQREDARAAKQLQRQEDAAAKQLAQQIDAENKRLAAQEKSDLEKEQKQLAAYAKQEQTVAQEHIKQQQADELNYAAARQKQEAANAVALSLLQAKFQQEQKKAAEKYVEDQKKLKEQEAKESDDYAKKQVATDKQHDDEVKKKDKQYNDQLTQQQKAESKWEDDLAAHLDKQVKSIDAEEQKRLQSENKAFTTQERQAAVSYAAQEAQLRISLGKQLTDYINIQEKMTNISADEATKRRAFILAEFGGDVSQARSQFQAVLGQVSGSRAAYDEYRQGERGGGSGGNVNMGGVNITVPGAGDPAAVAQAVRDQLIQTGRNNANSSSMFAGQP